MKGFYEFADSHPFLTFVLLAVTGGTIVEIVKALAK